MVSEKEGPRGLEWQVTVPNGSSVKLESEPAASAPFRQCLGLRRLASALKSKVTNFSRKVWKIGADDPRKVIHCIKVGLALTLVSLFYYTRPLYDGVGGTAMWSIMTVVVVFEFTVGGSLYKGTNRAMATLSAGALAVGLHWVATKSGRMTDHIVLGSAVFLMSGAATFSRFIPTIKARFDYGITIFILTFNLVAVSGYRVDELLTLAQRRLSTIMIGISICLIVCIVVCPIWAGEELHLLITRNMEKLADSIEECANEYLEEDDNSDSKKRSCQKLQGYKSVLNSKASEDSLANLARWEPSHGRFSFRHPWSQYLKVSSAMRYCAYCIEALNGCIVSDNLQAPDSIKKQLGEVCIKLSSESCKVLKELSGSIKSMRRSSIIDDLVGEMNNTVEELQNAVRTILEAAAAAATVQIMDAVPLITVASLLIEISARVEGVVDAVEDLAKSAGFKHDRREEIDEECKQTKKSVSSISPVQELQEEAAMKVLQKA